MPHDLIKGFKAFKKTMYEGEESSLMQELVRDGQDPDYFIISCIDSRAHPGIILKAKPGTFFAHKSMGAIVRPYEQGTTLAAALQFAINYNNVSKLIVLGHTGCGAVRALIDGLEDEEITSFVKVAQNGLKKAKICSEHDNGDLARHTEEQIILQSVENLKSYPSVKAALDKGNITIKPWLFEMEQGSLLEYNEQDQQFKTITD